MFGLGRKLLKILFGYVWISSLMLNPRFESLCLLISSYIGHEGVLIVEEYEKISLYPMLIKCHNHFNRVLITKIGWANQIVEKNCNLDIFEQIANTKN
jgi:hypothetical protein